MEAYPACLPAYSLTQSIKYPENFKHFDYVNPSAPKRGMLKRSIVGHYDTFDLFSKNGFPAAGLDKVYDTLMTSSLDEPATQYGLLATCMEVASDGRAVVFELNKKAKFHDGRPVLAEDVAFTFNYIKKHAGPEIRHYFREVTDVEVLAKRKVKFVFKSIENKELPLMVGGLAIMPKHYWQEKSFQANPFEMPLGSGPYKIAHYQPGKYIRYERVKDYWAANHPTRLGMSNFDELRWDYYLNEDVAFEAFKSAGYDFRLENVAKRWVTGYPSELIKDGKIIKSEVPNHTPQGMQGIFFNSRRDMFKDRQVRQAIGMAFDFNWTNKQLLHEAYVQSKSYFNNSELAATKAMSQDEKNILKEFSALLPPGYMASMGKNELRFKTLREALMAADKQLNRAGWVIHNGRRVNKLTLKPMKFEIIIVLPAYERIMLPFKHNLKRLGIEANIRLIDSAQYVDRLRSFNYDLTVFSYPASLVPANELMGYWHSTSADLKGSQNIAGIKDPLIDVLIQKVVKAPTYATMKVYVRALDRLLFWQYYAIPQWYTNVSRIAYWDKFSMPNVRPIYGVGIETWWARKDA